MKHRWLTVLGALITVASLYLAFRGTDIHEVVRSLREVGMVWMIPVLGSTLVSIWLRAFRWRVMLEPLHPVSTGQTYAATIIGFMANNVLPMRLGEVVRAYSIGRSTGVSKSAAFATIVVERAFDLLAVLLLLGFVVLRFRVRFPAWAAAAGYVALAACVGLFLTMGFIRWKRDLTLRLFASATRRLPAPTRESVRGLLHRFLDGLEVLARGHRLVWVMVLSLLTWLAVAVSFAFTALAFHLPQPGDASLLLVVLTALAVMLPSGPGFVGTFEMGVRYGLTLIGVSDNRALSVALFYHAVQFIPITLIGLYHLWRQNFSLRRAMEEESGAAG